MSMAAYDREGELCAGVVGACRMPIVVMSRAAPYQAREETLSSMREHVKSRCGEEGTKDNTWAGCCFQCPHPTANDVARAW